MTFLFLFLKINFYLLTGSTLKKKFGSLDASLLGNFSVMVLTLKKEI